MHWRLRHLLGEIRPYLLLLRQIITVRFFSVFLKKKVTKICIWRPSGIGDIIMLYPIAKSLKERFPHTRITYILRNKNVNIEVAKRIPSFDDIKINPDGVRFDDFKKKAGQSFDLILLPFYETIFNKYLKKTGTHKSCIASLYFSIGLKCPSNIHFVYSLTEEEAQFALEYKRKTGDYIILVDSSSAFTSKLDWPYEYWQRLIDLQTLPVMVIGTSKDRFEKCVDLRNKITINQCAALIKECRLFVGVVTGPFWFTRVFNKEAVIINGGFQPPILTQHPRSYHFFSDMSCAPCLAPDEECPHAMKCMKDITPEMVNEKIKALLTK